MTPDEHPQLRASDAERERAIDVLREAAGEGRLTLEELDERVGRAAGATTRAELELLVRDVPAAPVHDRELTLDAGRCTLVGDVRRDGEWLVPARSVWRTAVGNVRLDLRRARLGAPVIEIEARTGAGDIELLVPDGVIVDVRASALAGSVRQKAGIAAEPGAPRIILTGGTGVGDVIVRARRRRERLLRGRHGKRGSGG